VAAHRPIAEQRFLRELGERLRAAREGRGMTQAELARRCGLHRTFVGSVERGERNIAVLGLRRIAATLRVGLADLFGGR
jgi:transcriptional regulator with XRE-family HTH domain